MRIRVLGGIALVLSLAAPAHAEPWVTPEQAVARANAAAVERDALCAWVRWPEPGAMSDAAPSAELTEQLAILRRPQAEADLVRLEMASRLFGSVLRPGIRVAQGPDGRAYDVIPVAADAPRPPVCGKVEDRVLRRSTRDAKPKVRRAARVLLAERRALARPRGERLMVGVEYGGAWGGGGGVTAADVAAGRPGPGANGTVDGQPTLLYSLVRDGVASVTWRFTGGHEVTAPVQDNIAAVEVGFMRSGVYLERTLLHDASGAVIADVPAPA